MVDCTGRKNPVSCCVIVVDVEADNVNIRLSDAPARSNDADSLFLLVLGKRAKEKVDGHVDTVAFIGFHQKQATV